MLNNNIKFVNKPKDKQNIDFNSLIKIFEICSNKKVS